MLKRQKIIYKSTRTSHVVVWERDFKQLAYDWGRVHDSAERGPVDRDGARSHNTVLVQFEA